MLLELFPQNQWIIEPIGCFDEDNNLFDDNGQDILLYGSNVIYGQDMDETYFEDDSITLWYINTSLNFMLHQQRIQIFHSLSHDLIACSGYSRTRQ